MSDWQLVGFLLCVGLATCAQMITGFAMALILLGLSALFKLAPLPDVANVATVLALANAVIALRGTHGSLDRPMMRSTIIGSVLGVPVGVALLAWLSTNVVLGLRLLLGLVVIGCAMVVLLRTEPLAQRSSNRSFQGYGLLSGVLGGLFAASGPPLVYQFYRQPIPILAVRDTLVASLAAGGVLRLVMVLASGQFSALSLWLSLVTVPLALVVSWWMKKHPPAWRRETVLKLVCALLIVTGVSLIGPALRGLAG